MGFMLNGTDFDSLAIVKYSFDNGIQDRENTGR